MKYYYSADLQLILIQIGYELVLPDKTKLHGKD